MSMLFIFILFVLWFSFARKRTSHLQSKQADNFWERESNANHTRKTSLECLDYITIPLNLIELCSNTANKDLSECADILTMLSTEKIVNLNGRSNTELKLNYGSANLALLTDYEQNYTQLIHTLQKAGSLQKELGTNLEAIQILEFAVFHCKSDVSATYQLLASLYQETGKSEKISTLITHAEQLNTLMKESILTNLKAIR
jgi:hypothetical protein